MYKLNFREFIEPQEQPYKYDDIEVANLYFHSQGVPVREISRKTGKSIGEIYRILRKYGNPNRNHSNHYNVMSYADSGFSIPFIAELTGYTPRHVRNILKNAPNR